MRIVITGGSGFLGASLARALLAAGDMAVAGWPPRPVEHITLIDRVPAAAPLRDDPRVTVVVGDLAQVLQGPDTSHILEGTDVLYHLAAAVSADAEADFDLGLLVNVDGSRAVLQACRALGTAPVVVFASSLAVYGAWPGAPMPDVVTDTTLPTPRSSYGIQKFVVEQLVADYTRKGFIDGRSLRLMTVSVRPGRPNGAASSFLSGIVREPLAGERARCPVAADTRVAVSSPERTIQGLLLAAQTSAQVWGPPTALVMPALELSVGDMVAALEQVAGADVAALVDWVPDPAVGSIVAGWPARFDPIRAHALGLVADPDYETVIRAHLASR